jgi:CheY-like chemotaxis protein
LPIARRRRVDRVKARRYAPSVRPIVLVVDDHRDVRETIVAMLEREGFKAEQAEDATEALALAVYQPNLILVDLHMPGFDGFELCRLLKASPTTRRIPICAMTAVYGGSDDRREALAIGVDGFLRKPIDPLQLRATVLALLDRPSKLSA